jgi:hypothetical protein
MTRQRPLSKWLLLGAIFCGLNLLCFMGIAHGRGVEHHTRVNYSHVPAHRTGRVRSRDGWSGAVVVYYSVVDHATQIPNAQGIAAGPAATSHAALVSAGVELLQPPVTTEPLARWNVLALGSAPSAPGLCRGPPPLRPSPLQNCTVCKSSGL